MASATCRDGVRQRVALEKTTAKPASRPANHSINGRLTDSTEHATPNFRTRLHNNRDAQTGRIVREG